MGRYLLQALSLGTSIQMKKNLALAIDAASTERSFLIRGRSVPPVLFGGLLVSNSRAGLIGGHP